MSKRRVTAVEVVDDLTLLLRETIPDDLRESDITVKRIIDRGISPRVARRTIDQWVTAGKVRALGKRRAGNGSLVEAWEMVK